MIKNYYCLNLERKINFYDIISDIAVYYKKINQIEASLQYSFNIFPVEDM